MSIVANVSVVIKFNTPSGEECVVYMSRQDDREFPIIGICKIEHLQDAPVRGPYDTRFLEVTRGYTNWKSKFQRLFLLVLHERIKWSGVKSPDGTVIFKPDADSVFSYPSIEMVSSAYKAMFEGDLRAILADSNYQLDRRTVRTNFEFDGVRYSIRAGMLLHYYPQAQMVSVRWQLGNMPEDMVPYGWGMDLSPQQITDLQLGKPAEDVFGMTESGIIKTPGNSVYIHRNYSVLKGWQSLSTEIKTDPALKKFVMDFYAWSGAKHEKSTL